ncbi:MAG: hypothetical protein GJU76_02050 [Gallionella sp.]|nr:hypothetical protein [Gallionella sp.]
MARQALGARRSRSRHGYSIDGSELRIQHQKRPYRTLYAFDPSRTAILLIGGDKTGNDRWYEVFGMPVAARCTRGWRRRTKGIIMARKFEELRSPMTPRAQARARDKAREMLAEMPLDELRQARGLSQQMLATLLHVQQPAIAKLEKRTDMYISTLRSHIRAMGGELEITARFPEGTVRILNFADSEGAMDSGEVVDEG